MKNIKKKSNMNIQPGDKLLHITKYGGKNVIEVKSIEKVNYEWDREAMVVYENYDIVTTRGVYLNTDGSDGRLYKIERLLSIEEVEESDERQREWKERRAELFKQMRREDK
jgi:hypothetical protein